MEHGEHNIVADVVAATVFVAVSVFATDAIFDAAVIVATAVDADDFFITAANFFHCCCCFCCC